MYKDNYKKYWNDFDDKIQKELRKNNCVKLSKKAAKNLERNGLASWDKGRGGIVWDDRKNTKNSWWQRLWRKICKK